MRIALAQIDCRLGNIPENLRTHRQALTDARAGGGADLALFPELSLTGYRLRSNIHRAMLDDAALGATWETMRADGLTRGMHVALGYVELTRRAAIHNTVALLHGNRPDLEFRHRKVYLPTYGMFEEERYMRPGDRFRATDIVTADGERWRVGILCCEDAWHASAWTILQARGCDLILIPSASPGRGVESERLGSQRSWYGILSTFAELTGSWVAFCNRVGFEDDIHFWGGSAVLAPTGETRCQACDLEPDLLLCDIDRRALTTARIATPLGASEDWALTIRELEGALAERLREE